MKKSNPVENEWSRSVLYNIQKRLPEVARLLPKKEFCRVYRGGLLEQLLTDGLILRISPLHNTKKVFSNDGSFREVQITEPSEFRIIAPKIFSYRGEKIVSELMIYDNSVNDWLYVETNGHDSNLELDEEVGKITETERGDLDQKKLVIPPEKKEIPVFDPQPETTSQPEKVTSAGGNVILSSQGKLISCQTNDVSPGAINLNDKMISQFLASIDVENQTKRNYFQGLKKLQEYSNTNSEWFTPKGLIAYKEYLKQKGLDTDSINTYIIAVRRLFKYLFNHGLIPFNPVEELKNFRKKKSRRTAFSHTQVKLLLDTIINENRPTVFRDYAMTRLIAKTGLREMSVQNAKIEDIGIKDGQYILWVLVKGHQAKDEFVILTDGLYEDLQNAIDGRPEGYIFVGQGNKNTGEQLSKEHINRTITSYMRLCGIKDKSNCVHSLRNFYIKETLRKGAKLEEVQLSVHHTDPKTTMGYAHDLERTENPVEAFIRGL